METEIAPAIPYPVAPGTALNFSRQVIERFQNPHIQHKWLNITQNYSAKILSRVMPTFVNYEKLRDSVPDYMAFGFAAYIYYMKATRKDGDNFYGIFNGDPYLIQDQKAAYFYQKWQVSSLPEMVVVILKDQSIWGKDLSKSEVLSQNVVSYLESIKQNGALETLKSFLEKVEYARTDQFQL
jgi:tagaturonate reductase